MKITKPYVRIQSEKNIQVTCGLQNNDVTNPDAHVPDRLKISPVWPLGLILIKQGAHIYPSEIVEWNTVKALAKDKILTIGEFLEEAEIDADVKDLKNKLKDALKTIEPTKEIKEKKLSEIAGDEE